ncbi:MAG: ABC transporter permease, partial [Gammaproteobacteria bacterium]
ASSFLHGTDIAQTARRSLSQVLFADDFWRLARQHVNLVFVSVLAAVLLGVPGGVAAALLPRFGVALLAVVGALQTIPSLALLALLITAIGAIGTVPALVALFCYALLPIVRNTSVGVERIPDGIREAAAALGIRGARRIWLVDLPLALPVILAGVRTAAVINVGTATIAAFIGAGGFGERIAVGLALNDREMLLAGALPAAALAFLVEGLFAALERWVARRHGG